MPDIDQTVASVSDIGERKRAKRLEDFTALLDRYARDNMERCGRQIVDARDFEDAYIQLVAPGRVGKRDWLWKVFSILLIFAAGVAMTTALSSDGIAAWVCGVSAFLLVLAGALIEVYPRHQ
jgi:hypothetical protein